MSKKISTYDELLIEKQKLEMLFQAQKELIQYEIKELKEDFEPAFNALEFLKKIALRNTDNPIMQTGLSLLIDKLSDKFQGDDAGFLRSTIVSNLIKNYASNFLAGQAEDLIENLLYLFTNEEESPTES